MNKNGRGSYDQRSGTRVPPRNNINIQINFNVKDKNQAFAGKKIDNYMQVEQKNTKGELPLKLTQDKGKKAKKEATDKLQKDRNFDTPVKYKQFQRNKANRHSDEKTPEKKSIEKREERSKSTNQKLVKRKGAKSMENIKTGIRYTRNKETSPNSSAEKSRSHSKSSKKLLKSSQQSLKNLYMFTNSGIKNKVGKEKISNSRERQISAASKKPLKEEDQEKLKKFMEQKKRKSKLEKNKQLKQEKIKKEKVREELKRVEAERRANANKPLPYSKKELFQRQQRLPIYCFDDDFDQSSQFQKLKKEANQIIHQSPPPSNIMNAVPSNHTRHKQNHENSSSKKLKKHNKDSLAHKFIHKTINQRQLQELQKKVTKIQAFWRGYSCRRQFIKKLNDQATRFRYIKNKIDNKKGAFWNDGEENSVINVQKDTSTIKVYESANSSINYINYTSNVHSDLSHNDYRVVVDQKQKTDKFKRLSINIDHQNQLQIQLSKERSQKQTFENSKMLRQIEELRKMLERQTQKYKSLEQENQALKANIKVLSLKQSREIGEQPSQDLISSNDFIQIRMPKKIQQSSNSIIRATQTFQLDSNSKASNQSQQKANSQEKSVTLDSFKKQFQIFQCSSPSNARLQQQLRQLKAKNIQGIFWKKQIKIVQKYAKKSEMFDKMLNDKIFSPRTYNEKKKQLQTKLKLQKQEVKQRITQAKRVVGFIEEVSSQQDIKDIRQTHRNELDHKDRQIHKKKIQIEPNFKKAKNVIDSYTNTSPLEGKQIAFKNNLIERKKQDRSQSEYSSDSQKIYRKYWTDDIEEVHKHTLEITKKIEEAMNAQSQGSSNRFKEQGKESSESYNSNEFHSEQTIKNEHEATKHQKSKSQEVNLQSLKESYQQYLEETNVIPTQSERKARQIFNKIDLSEQNQCKSEGSLENSHENICQLLNQRPLHNSPNTEDKHPSKNLYISEAQFNKKKKIQEQLSKSSSFQKSNKSLSANNSQLQYKGFITNLTFIKEFCISFCEFIRNSDHYRQLFVQNISQSIKYDRFEYLRAYRITITGQIKNEYVYPYFRYITQKKNALDDELFKDFLIAYQEEKSKDLTWNDPSMNKHTREMRQYFLNSIKDNFNQSLEYQKPGSIYAEPLPWLCHSKNLKNHQNISLKNLNNVQKKYSSDSSDYEQQNEEAKRLDQIFGSSIAKIIQWGSCLCGFIADPMPMQMGDSQIANLSDQQLNSIRENRVGLMLQKWLLQEEELMTNSTSEYTEVMLFLSEKVIELLIRECAEEVQEIWNV